MKFKSEQTELKLHRIADIIVRSDSELSKNCTYDKADIIALSQVFNVPESDIKKVYENFFEVTKFPMIFTFNK
jgi:hypothetical protein